MSSKQRFNLSAYAVTHPALSLYFLVVVALAGLWAFMNMGRAEDPSFDVNTMVVSASWPGASAEQMQGQVADPLTRELMKIRYMDRVETKAQPGAVNLLITFADHTPGGLTQDLYYQVRKRLTDVAPALPQGVQGPVFNDDFEDVYFSLYALTAPGLSQSAMLDTADHLQVQLSRIQGVKKVDLIGEQASRLWVDLDLTALSQRQLSPAQIRQALQAQFSVTAGGFSDTQGPRLYLRSRLNGQGTEPDARGLAKLPLQIGEQSLRLGDVAEVYAGVQDPPTFLVRNQGERALMLGVVMQDQTNGLTLEERLKAFETTLHQDLPVGMQLDKVTNQADAIKRAVSTFELKFMTALLVVWLVSLATLGLRAGVVVALAVPLTLALTFVFMVVEGFNLDRITLGALIISLGLLVDDAIIAIEMMLVKMKEGLDKARAAAFAWQVTAAPMLVGTLVTVVGFLPIGLAQSRVGDYAGGIFWVLGTTLIASWLVAVYFIPYLGVKLLKVTPAHATGSGDDPYQTRFYQRLRSLIKGCVRRRKTVVATTIGVFGLSVVGMATQVEKQFFPSSDRPELMVDVYLPKGSSIRATDAVVRELETVIKDYDEVESLSAYVGQGAPRFFLALNPELPNPAFAKIIAVTHDKEARVALRDKLQARIDAGEFSEARVRVHPLLFGPPVQWPVSFRVMGPELDQLRPVAQRLRTIMAEQAFTRDPHIQWGEQAPVLELDFNADRLARLGLTQQAVKAQLAAALQGAVATEIKRDRRTLAIKVRADESARTDPSRLADLPIRLPASDTAATPTVPLSHLAELRWAHGLPWMERRNREPVLQVNAQIVAGMQPPVATETLMQAFAPVLSDLPHNVRVEVAGSVEESSKAQSSIQVMMPLMLLVISLLIMLLVKSISTLFMVLVTAPLGLIGAVAAMLLFDQPFGFVANLGLIGLGGILMRNTLILTGQIDDNRRQGMALSEALVDATVRRARPVILTALAAMLAFIPLTTSTFWGPMAYVLIGGIGVGTVLTLVFLPALYALWFRVRVA
ncbi:efflux RND transporter permease subunit [Thiomicrospira sp. WB1]|uniref:efflux RND transporter permease subunit n=1 Tax=Thiomicrospira sp. WB1 TaxID=1685380 RepID=UPI0007480C4C|nr:efflux RND transporter permease subunit [Thiomicrospira sp. WB1]KUJ72356.1 multidrug transporter [Thiomicrospira sp. WB1]